jgi:hypothetical protein
MDSKLSGVLDMLEEASIQLSEATDELRHYRSLDLDPNRLFELEQRISRQIALRGSIKSRPKSFLTFTSHCWKSSVCWMIAPVLWNLLANWSLSIISWRWIRQSSCIPCAKIAPMN